MNDGSAVMAQLIMVSKARVFGLCASASRSSADRLQELKDDLPCDRRVDDEALESGVAPELDGPLDPLDAPARSGDEFQLPSLAPSEDGPPDRSIRWDGPEEASPTLDRL